MKTWIPDAALTDFTIHHLPFGIFTLHNQHKRIGVAIGNHVLDLFELHRHGFLKNLDVEIDFFQQNVLNPLMAKGRHFSKTLRKELQDLLLESNSSLQHSEHIATILIPQDMAQMHLPIAVGDYTDFYSSEEHATNVGTMFRGAENALMPNWKQMPIGYHGRASSIIASGTNFHRPIGQKKPKNEGEQPPFGPSSRLDIELETAFITCKENDLGHAIPIDKTDEYIWGFTLFNDWSARDIQAWEYVPLGPFLGKNFASSISNWITPMDALEPFRVQGPKQELQVLPYLQKTGKQNFDIKLEAWLETKEGTKQKLCSSNTKFLYWSINQQLAHQTVNGCNVKVGDVYGSGTISGSEESSFGSLLELTWNGQKPIELQDGSRRTFLEDFDTVILKGICDNGSIKFGLGEVKAQILPSTKQMI